VTSAAALPHLLIKKILFKLGKGAKRGRKLSAPKKVAA